MLYASAQGHPMSCPAMYGTIVAAAPTCVSSGVLGGQCFRFLRRAKIGLVYLAIVCWWIIPKWSVNDIKPLRWIYECASMRKTSLDSGSKFSFVLAINFEPKHWSQRLVITNVNYFCDDIIFMLPDRHWAIWSHWFYDFTILRSGRTTRIWFLFKFNIYMQYRSQ